MDENGETKNEAGVDSPVRGRHLATNRAAEETLSDGIEQAVAASESPVEDENSTLAGEASDENYGFVPNIDVLELDGESSDDAEAASKDTSPVAAETAKKFSLPVMLGVGIVALAVGLVVGMFVLGGGAGTSAVTGKASIAEGDLDTPIASYTYQGKTEVLSVRDAILQSSSLESAKADDGTYAVPTADVAMGVVRNKLLVETAEAQGIAVTDEDVAAYAKESLGTDDYESIAMSYGMDAASVESLLRESCLMGKLRETVVTAEEVEMPEQPAEPDSSDEEAATTPTKEYADYIIALAGDEWDEAKGTWKSTDGPYASTLAETYEITSEGATYEAAVAAYYIAYQQYSEKASAASVEWTNYVNGVLANSTIQIYTLLA